MNNNANCEIQTAGGWKSVSVEDPLALDRNELKRCPECRGRVVVMKDGKTASSPAHYEHRPAHPGCSHSFTFDGTKRPHPNPLD